MKISVPKERRPHERRVAASPDTVKRLTALGHELVVESGAGAAAAFTDDAYQAAGARIARDMGEAMGAGDIVLKVQRPLPDELKAMKRGAVLIGMLAPLQYGDDVPLYASAGIYPHSYFHVGLVVADIEAAMAQLGPALGLTFNEPHTSVYGGETIHVAYARQGPPYYELVEGSPGGRWNTERGR